MKTTTTTIKGLYKYNEGYKFNKWLVSGKWYNEGETAEILYKVVNGFKVGCDRRTPFDLGSDVSETSESLKTFRSRLTDERLGSNKADVIKAFFDRVASKWFTFIALDREADTLTAYKMSADEFKEFIEEFGAYEKSTGRVRFRNIKRERYTEWLGERA